MDIGQIQTLLDPIDVIKKSNWDHLSIDKKNLGQSSKSELCIQTNLNARTCVWRIDTCLREVWFSRTKYDL